MCNRKFEKIKGLSAHIFWSHKLSSKQYYDKFLKKKNEDICENENCNRRTTWTTIIKGYNRFCCDICGNTSKARKNEERKRMLNVHAKTNLIDKMKEGQKKYWSKKENKRKASIHSKSIWNDEKIRTKLLRNARKTWKSEEYREKKRKISTKIAKDPEWRKRVSRGTKIGQRKNPTFIEDRREYMLNGGAAYCNQFIKNPSKPQIELFEMVQKIMPYCYLNYPCGRYSIDIAIPDLNFAIEYDGEYWHQNKDYDLKRQKEIEEDGWKFIRFYNKLPSIEELKWKLILLQ